MKFTTLRLFSFLDLICLVFLGMQLWLILNSDLFSSNVRLQLYTSARFLTFALIASSCIGLFKGAKWGLIAYYAQFPFRIGLFIYSIGFITLLPEAFGSYESFWYDWLLGVCVLFEFFRLYLTVLHHRSLLQK